MSGVSYPRRYEVVTYPEGQEGTEGWAGFQARIMINPNGAERRAAGIHFRAYLMAGKEKDPPKDATPQHLEDEYWRFVAPWIVEWNLEKEQESGGTVTYPPPAEQWDAIYELEPSVMLWLALQIQTAYLPKATAPTPLVTDAGITDTTPPTEIHPSSSSTPSASTLSA